MTASIYTISDKGKLSKEGEKFIFCNIDGTRQDLFPFKIGVFVFIGSISITEGAFRLLAKHKISAVFLSSNGKFNSKLVYNESKNVFLRQKQYLLSVDELKKLQIAKMIVSGKIKNQISFMQRIKRKNEIQDQVEDAINKIKNILDDVEKAKSLDSLRGYEGNASKLYFEVFRYNLIPEWADFPKRSKNPPETNVNAVLSFLYTLLLYRVEAAIETEGLDPMVGNLHAMDYGTNTLVFDLMEEFRSPIVDVVCCSLFNLGQLCEEDFVDVNFNKNSEDFPAENNKNGILLTKEGLKKVIPAFEKKLETEIQIGNERLTYQQIIFSQVQKYKRYICGEQNEYSPFYAK